MTENQLPLSRITVLDLTVARAGPTAVRQLADWGADVIRIEPPGGKDDVSATRRHGSDFQNLHRNKRCMTLNLKTDSGRKIFYELVERSDVVVENFRAGVKHRLGIDYETLKAIQPRIVYASISGFGQDGPYRDRPGVDQITQGLGGLMSVTGLPGQGPVRVGTAISDLAAGLYLAFGILVALFDRDRSGQGQWVHTSLLEALIGMLDFQAARWLRENRSLSDEDQRALDEEASWFANLPSLPSPTDGFAWFKSSATEHIAHACVFASILERNGFRVGCFVEEELGGILCQDDSQVISLETRP